MYSAIIGFLSAIIGGIISSVIAPFLTKNLEVSKRREEIIQIEKINLYKELHSLLNKIFIFDVSIYTELNWNNFTSAEKENICKTSGIEKMPNSYNEYIAQANSKIAVGMSKNFANYEKKQNENSLFLPDEFLSKSKELVLIWNSFAGYLLEKRNFPPNELHDKLKSKIEECQNILKKELKINI